MSLPGCQGQVNTPWKVSLNLPTDIDKWEPISLTDDREWFLRAILQWSIRSTKRHGLFNGGIIAELQIYPQSMYTQYILWLEKKSEFFYYWWKQIGTFVFKRNTQHWFQLCVSIFILRIFRVKCACQFWLIAIVETMESRNAGQILSLEFICF